MKPVPSCVSEHCTALFCTEISLFDRARETEGSAPSSVDRCLGKVCVPTSGKAKRPAIRPSVDCPTYGQKLGRRQGRQLHMTNRSIRRFLGFPPGSFGGGAMADEARLAQVKGRRRGSSLSTVPDPDSSDEWSPVEIGCLEQSPIVKRVRDRGWIGGFNSPAIQRIRYRMHLALATFESCGRVSCTQTGGLQGLSGRALTRNQIESRGTPQFNFGHGRKFEAAVAQWRSMSADQAAGFLTSAQGGLAQRNPPCYLSCSGG